MHRIVEPELMEGEEQASAYAQVDFSGKGDILDIGCRPADILICFAHKKVLLIR